MSRPRTLHLSSQALIWECSSWSNSLSFQTLLPLFPRPTILAIGVALLHLHCVNKLYELDMQWFNLQATLKVCKMYRNRILVSNTWSHPCYTYVSSLLITISSRTCSLHYKMLGWLVCAIKHGYYCRFLIFILYWFLG